MLLRRLVETSALATEVATSRRRREDCFIIVIVSFSIDMFVESKGLLIEDLGLLTKENYYEMLVLEKLCDASCKEVVVSSDGRL